jgi:D-glycero-alpha-D-manno-heptose 1-phosphate guanylyltransferase
VNWSKKNILNPEPMITEAIVLAGGLGTRLKPVIADLPKSLAPVAGKPFLGYLLDYARLQGIKKFVFALGYKAEQLETFVKQYLPADTYVFSLEDEPLGTGGAIYKACHQVSTPNCIVLNADTFFGISFLNLSIIHELQKAACTLSLKPMKSFDRYGAVTIEKQMITGFSEKKFHTEGLINGGVYALSVRPFLEKKFAAVFSFEKDYLEKEYAKGNILGMKSDAYFIDIGIPEDYKRAQLELIQHIS